MSEERTSYVDHHVVDEQQNDIGKVTDVLYDDDEHDPKWFVVKMGALGAAHYVPAAGSYTSEDGNIVIAYDKKSVKSAPKAGSEHVLTASQEADAERHYELTS